MRETYCLLCCATTKDGSKSSTDWFCSVHFKLNQCIAVNCLSPTVVLIAQCLHYVSVGLGLGFGLRHVIVWVKVGVTFQLQNMAMVMYFLYWQWLFCHRRQFTLRDYFAVSCLWLVNLNDVLNMWLLVVSDWSILKTKKKILHPQVSIPHPAHSLAVYTAPYIYIPGLPLQCTLPFF